MKTNLGSYQTAVDKVLSELTEGNIIARIFAHDYTVWSSSPDEITNRLGWLRISEEMLAELPRIEALADALRTEGYTDALLLGMGGSSLAPEVFRNTFGVTDTFLDLAVLDSTDPHEVLARAQHLDLAKTLFVVSTKSGGTAETLSFFKHFYNRVIEAVGQGEAGKHFIAITDPGSSLVALAEKYHFRDVFLNNPNIGGRYSALSFFGLVPAGLIGANLKKLLAYADAAVNEAQSGKPAAEIDSVLLGAIMGVLAQAGRDKITFLASPLLENFGDWVEQLIAESTGKNGKGIVPVVHEPAAAPSAYGDDRLFVHLRMNDDHTHDSAVAALEAAGQPVVTITLEDPYELGAQCFEWELATAIAGHVIGIQPFDQPNVESAKVQARKMIAAYHDTGALPPQTAALKDDGMTVYGDVQADSGGAALNAFLSQARSGDYIALQAYLPLTQDIVAALNALREKLFLDSEALPKCATTLGYGPRFLHSTGQLHKGDAGNGLFIQFTADPAQDVPIPDEAGKPESAMSFGLLEMAQTLGDAQALRENKRRVIRFHLGDDAPGGLKKLTESLR